MRTPMPFIPGGCACKWSSPHALPNFPVGQLCGVSQPTPAPHTQGGTRDACHLWEMFIWGTVGSGTGACTVVHAFTRHTVKLSKQRTGFSYINVVL